MGTKNNPGEARCRCGELERYHCHSEGGSQHRVKAANGESGCPFIHGHFFQQKDGELQSARSRPEDATGNPSSSPLPDDGSTSAGAGPQGEPVTADTEGQPRQDEASLPFSTTKTRYDNQKRSGCRTPNSMYRSVISDRTVAIRVLLPFAPKLTKDEAVALETRLECAVENVLAGLFEPIGDAIAELEAHLRDERREWTKSREHFDFVIGKKLQQIEELERKVTWRDEEIAKLRTRIAAPAPSPVVAEPSPSPEPNCKCGVEGPHSRTTQCGPPCACPHCIGDPRDVRIAELEAERLQSTARFNRTRREWLRQMADLERTVTQLQTANTREVEARRAAELSLRACGGDEPWTLMDAALTLATAADHLLVVHDCDKHRHEAVRHAIETVHRLAAIREKEQS